MIDKTINFVIIVDMPIKIIKDKISIQELRDLAREGFGNVIKAVVDAEQEIMAVGGELHADEEVELMEKEASKREYMWGINLLLEKFGTEEFIEFDSMVNIKPVFGNRSRGVENPEIQEKIKNLVGKLVVFQNA